MKSARHFKKLNFQEENIRTIMKMERYRDMILMFKGELI